MNPPHLMNYFQLYEAERKLFHVGARFKYDDYELEITHISKYNITLRYLNGPLPGCLETCPKSFVKFMFS